MTMQSALAETNRDDDIWARPIHARGAGYGYVYRDGFLAMVPGRHGAQACTIRRQDVEAEWEAVYSDVILDERKEPTP